MKTLQEILTEAQCHDRGRLISSFIALQKQKIDSQSHAYQKLMKTASLSANKTQQRKRMLPEITYPSLPVVDRLDEIKSAIINNQVLIVAGETGSGKSTQLPKICLDLGLGTKGFIGHTQPRRLAARSIANRLSQEMQIPIGQGVGFKIRFSDQTDQNTFVKVMTDGILLAEIQNDKYLSQYEVIIIDEAHERSLNIDFLLGHLHQILKKRPDLKLIITSATIDQARFAQHFNAPIIEVTGRTYPVEIRYQDPLEFNDDLSQAEQVLRAIDQLSHEKPGDILVFLATERNIHTTADFLQKAQLRHTEILPLFARLSASDQDKIFNPSGVGRRIILSTNVAETSLTVPGIRYVIDSGEVRISRYSYKTKVQRLPIEPISQASANQRAGRCGRIAEGICIRLYSKEDFDARAEFTDPEILRTNLASVILQMEVLKLGNIDKFPFIDKPDSRFIKDGYRLLHEIGAVDTHNHHHHIQITPAGRIIAKFPVDPRLAKMLVTAQKLHVLQELLIIVSFLSIQDPRERPMQFQQKSDQIHKQDHHQDSDFLGILQLWQRFYKQTNTLTHRQKRDYCKKNFLSILRMREWREIYQQLLSLAKAQKWVIHSNKSDDDAIHQAIVSGLLSHIGFNYEAKEYLGARGLKFHIFPGSSQFKKTPKWICAAEITETTKLYARMVAKIKPEWLETLASHLIKKHYFDPFWSQKQRAVIARLRISLYGLDIVTNRPVQYQNIDPVQSREIFIRHALVYGEFDTKAEFFKQNLLLLEAVEDLENKARKRDIVIDDETLFQYYDQIIPKEISSGVDFEKWVKTLSKQDQKNLIFTKDKLMQHDAVKITQDAYPDYFDFGEIKLPLSYHFDPTALDDGITMRVPLILIDQIDQTACQWLVPGMIEDKIIAMMKALPKNIRKACVPVPQFAKAILESITFDPRQDFKKVLTKELVRITGIYFEDSIWDDVELPAYLHMRFEVIDEKGKTHASGRDLNALRQKLRHIKSTTIDKPTSKSTSQQVYQDWEFDDLPASKQVNQHGIKVTIYPCLIEQKDGVIIDYKTTVSEANQETCLGVRRLFMQKCHYLHKSLKDAITHKSQLDLLFTMIKYNQWQNDFILKVFDIAFDLENKRPIRTKAEFDQRLLDGKGRVIDTAKAFSSALYQLMLSFQVLHKKLNRKKLPLDILALYQSINSLLGKLIYKDFIIHTPYQWLKRLDVYIKALQGRLEKAPRNLSQDRQYQIEFDRLQEQLQAKITQKGLSKEDSEVQAIQWLLYELWISWYAQEIKTIETVSTTRLKKRIHPTLTL
ncbi:ATP-dependent RNA helicase HrpA, partial [Facilibium subflavum]|uniref:ATP-dependent RNA helicase HrpA n=1 Tax=Facilibium subflavum TaxID=2219058 RepID=UPI000E65B7DF